MEIDAGLKAESKENAQSKLAWSKPELKVLGADATAAGVTSVNPEQTWAHS